MSRHLVNVVALMLFVPVFAAAQQPPLVDPAVVTVGEGVVQAVPDRAWITIGAESRAPSAREAQRRNAEAMTPIQDKLRAAGLAAEAIRTVGYDVQYEWDYVNNRRVGRGYVARNTIEVRVDAMERLPEYLEIAVGSGATSLSGIRFDLKDREKLEREALRQAVTSARARAEAIAAGAGRTLDRIIRLEELGVSGGPEPRPMFREAQLAASAAPMTPISTGQIEIRASVRLTMALK